MQTTTPAQAFLIERGTTTGLAMLAICAPIGLLADSTLMGMLAGVGLGMAGAARVMRRGPR